MAFVIFVNNNGGSYPDLFTFLSCFISIWFCFCPQDSFICSSLCDFCAKDFLSSIDRIFLATVNDLLKSHMCAQDFVYLFKCLSFVESDTRCFFMCVIQIYWWNQLFIDIEFFVTEGFVDELVIVLPFIFEVQFPLKKKEFKMFLK